MPHGSPTTRCCDCQRPHRLWVLIKVCVLNGLVQLLQMLLRNGSGLASQLTTYSTQMGRHLQCRTAGGKEPFKQPSLLLAAKGVHPSTCGSQIAWAPAPQGLASASQPSAFRAYRLLPASYTHGTSMESLALQSQQALQGLPTLAVGASATRPHKLQSNLKSNDPLPLGRIRQ